MRIRTFLLALLAASVLAPAAHASAPGCATPGSITDLAVECRVACEDLGAVLGTCVEVPGSPVVVKQCVVTSDGSAGACGGTGGEPAGIILLFCHHVGGGHIRCWLYANDTWSQFFIW